MSSSASFQLGTYLEQYLESVNSLPAEIRRNFQLMHDLDTRCHDLFQHIEKDSKIYLQSVKKGNKDDELLDNIQKDFKTTIEYSDEKVALAVQTYELVDKYIRRLDIDLKKFETELAPTMGNMADLNYGNANGQSDSEDTPSRERRHKRKGEDHQSEKKSKSGRASAEKALRRKSSESAGAQVWNVDLDMPIDPNEPTYCLCKRVSFGEMVGCDNPDCKVEWFHFECVGLTTSPKGKWMCPECKKLLNTRMRK